MMENAGTAVRACCELIPETYYTDPNHWDAVYVYADKLLENEDWDGASTSLHHLYGHNRGGCLAV